jgi:hypothetical protein
MRFQRLLTRSVRGIWITSYSFGLRLFDQYMLRTVSQSQLNAVVLADQEKLAEVWRNLPEGEEYLARKAGRRYLLRGVRSAGGGAFHPKTYLFSGTDGATLVVGSGNLTRDGIDHGHEVFTSFDSGHESDLPSMRAWAEWMSGLVEHEEDEILRTRWAALRADNPWMLGPSEASSFLANDQEPMLDQLTARLDSVTELHVTAPFFDREARALRKLIHACDPHRIELYVGAGMKVDGPSLTAALGGVGELRVRRFDPHGFVHAKLIGAIEPGDRGVVLVGSPNLSTAALLGVCTQPGGGNWETAVLREGTGEKVKAVFEDSPRLTLTEVPLESLESLEFQEDESAATGLLTLRSAVWREDGRVATSCFSAAELPAGTVMCWADGSQTVALDGDGVTVDPLSEHEPAPLLVWLAATDGTALTNKVPVDDPAALEETLLGNRQKRDSRPSELQGAENSPLIRIALWANDKFIFDPDQESAFRRAQEAIEAPEAEDAGDFWERYAREELRYDPRSQSYRPLTPRGGAASPVEELLRELKTMLDAAPGEPGPRLRLLHGEAVAENEEAEAEAGTPWSMEARHRRRAFNLFMRWSRAVGDPRHMLIAPSAPVVNYETLVGVIFAAWTHGALEPKHLRKLTLTLLTAFIGVDERRPGFLGRIDEEQRAESLQRLDPFVRELAVGLAVAALESSWRGTVYDWQPVLRRGLELDVLLPGEWSVRTVERLLGQKVTVDWIYELLQDRIEYVDEETWCRRLADELGFEDVSLELNRAAKVRSWVFVRGSGDPLADTRLLSLAHRFLEFKDVPAVAVKTDRGEVLVFEPGKHARALLAGVSRHSPMPVTLAQLEEIERQGGSWADLLDVAAA